MKRMLTTMVGLGFFLSSVALAADAPDKKTERLWKAKCASCHGMDGKGQTDQGKKQLVEDMTTAAYQTKLTDEDIKKVILEGLKKEKNGVKQEMEPYKDTLKPEQVDALVGYTRWLGKK